MVLLDDRRVPVIIGLEEASLRMSSGGSEIGEWANGEYAIDHRGDGVYTITAENEALEFVPANPALFAAGLAPGPVPVAVESPEMPTGAPTVEATNARTFDDSDTPPPKPATVAVFYTIATGTALLGLWALLSLFI